VHQLYIDLKKAYNSIRSEVIYNILTEFGFPMKLVRLIKICPNETYSRIQVGKHLSDMFLINKCLKRRMVHISFWFMLVMLIYWTESYIL